MKVFKCSISVFISVSNNSGTNSGPQTTLLSNTSLDKYGLRGTRIRLELGVPVRLELGVPIVAQSVVNESD